MFNRIRTAYARWSALRPVRAALRGRPTHSATHAALVVLYQLRGRDMVTAREYMALRDKLCAAYRAC